jgi:hypothetical protein
MKRRSRPRNASLHVGDRVKVNANGRIGRVKRQVKGGYLVRFKFGETQRFFKESISYAPTKRMLRQAMLQAQETWTPADRHARSCYKPVELEMQIWCDPVFEPLQEIW